MGSPRNGGASPRGGKESPRAARARRGSDASALGAGGRRGSNASWLPHGSNASQLSRRSDGKLLQFDDLEGREKLEEEEGEKLSWCSWYGCARRIQINCRKRARVTREVLVSTVKSEMDVGASRTRTARRCRDIYRLGVGGVRQSIRDWPRTQWARLHGTTAAAQAQRSPEAKVEGKIAKVYTEGAFGVPKCIVMNPQEVQQYFNFDGDEIGAGGTAKVYRATERKTHVVRAIKRVSKRDAAEYSRVANEVEILKVLDHPHICKLFEVFGSKDEDKHLYLVLEFCEGGDLMDNVIENGPLPEFQTAIVAKNIMMTLNYIHSNSIVHRDIKPENILFRDVERNKLERCKPSSLRIVDFGFSCKLATAKQRMNTKIGSPYFVAPEVLSGNYDKQCDLWSLGALIYLVLCGYPPFAGKTDAHTLNLIRSGKFVFPHMQWHAISKSAKHLVRHLLEVDVKKRLSLRKALEHDWIRSRIARSTENLRDETIDRLITFHMHHKFRQAAMLAIAYQLDACNVAHLRDLFHGMDLNGDGILTRTEFMRAVHNSGIDETFVQEMIKSVDSDNSGVIDYTEFLAATLERDMYIKNHAVCLRAFKSFDHDDSGSIEKDELIAFLGLNNIESIAMAQEMFNQVDTNQDGALDYGDFHAMLRVEIDPDRNLFDEEDDSADGSDLEEDDNIVLEGQELVNDEKGIAGAGEDEGELRRASSAAQDIRPAATGEEPMAAETAAEPGSAGRRRTISRRMEGSQSFGEVAFDMDTILNASAEEPWTGDGGSASPKPHQTESRSATSSPKNFSATASTGTLSLAARARRASLYKMSVSKSGLGFGTSQSMVGIAASPESSTRKKSSRTRTSATVGIAMSASKSALDFGSSENLEGISPSAGSSPKVKSSKTRTSARNAIAASASKSALNLGSSESIGIAASSRYSSKRKSSRTGNSATNATETSFSKSALDLEISAYFEEP